VEVKAVSVDVMFGVVVDEVEEVVARGSTALSLRCCKVVRGPDVVLVGSSPARRDVV